MTMLRRAVAISTAPLLLAGCISFGPEAPAMLFDLTPEIRAAAGSEATGLVEQAIGVSEVDAPRKLAVMRIPVQVDATNIAYLQDAQWVERPSRLFSSLLAETLRASTSRMVIDSGNSQFVPETQLSGTLREMGYDAATQSVIVRFDATLTEPNGLRRTQRFESILSGVAPDALSVGPALNRAANDVAGQVASWVTP